MKHPPPSAPRPDMIYVVDLPLNDSQAGFSFTGGPPQVAAASAAFPNVNGSDLVGCFVTAVQLPEVEISGFFDTRTLQHVLEIHQHMAPRRLVLSTHAPAYFTNQGLLYRYHLPGDPYLGVTFDSFPAKVAAVEKLSRFSGRILPGQFVESVVVPGYPDLNFQSGGFTGHRVSQYLQETSKVAGRQIVIKDNPINPTARVSAYEQRDPFDFGGFAPSNWFRKKRTPARRSNY